MSHEYWLNKAVELACRNVQQQGGPFAALIVRDNILIAQSGNRVTQQLDPTAHAEVQAIRMACQALGDFQLADCVLYSSCEPCPMCLGASYWARLKAIYYAADRGDAARGGFDDAYIYEELALPAEQRRIETRQIVLTTAFQPFTTWLSLNDKVLY